MSAKLVDPARWSASKTRTAHRERTLGGNGAIGYLTTGAIGCILGHARVWEHVAQQEAPWSLVMEDDIVQVHPQLEALLCSLMRKEPLEGLKDDWELLQLQIYCFPYGEQGLTLGEGIDYNTGMYLLKKEAAAKMLNETFPIRTDAQLDDPKGPIRSSLTRLFYTNPSAAAQKGSNQDTDVQIFFQMRQHIKRRSEAVVECSLPSREHLIEPALFQELP